MSTRSGEFVTLRELRQEVGSDAARFFYVMRRCEQHLDFDLDLADAVQFADDSAPATEASMYGFVYAPNGSE